MMSRPFVTVAICSLNGARHIAKTLSAIHDQDYPKHLIEIVVVDDGSSDETGPVAQSHGARVITHPRNVGRPAARNTALNAAQGMIIAFTDDDCLPAPGWLSSLVAPYDDADVVASGGRIFSISRKTPTERYMEYWGYGNPAPFGLGQTTSAVAKLAAYIHQMAQPLHLKLKDRQPLQEVFTANAAYRVDKLRAIGGFDAKLLTAEDSDVSARLHLAYPSMNIVFAEGADVGHKHYTRFFPWLKQTFRRSQDTFAQAKKDGHLPPVFPFPVAVGVFAIAALAISPLATAVTLALAPILLYWWWQLRVKDHPIDRLLFPYMQFLLESSALAGYALAFLRRSNPQTLKPNTRRTG